MNRRAGSSSMPQKRARTSGAMSHASHGKLPEALTERAQVPLRTFCFTLSVSMRLGDEATTSGETNWALSFSINVFSVHHFHIPT